MSSPTSVGLIIGGAGAAIGGVIVAIIQSIGGKAESRAKAADLVVNSAGVLLDRATKRDERLENENDRLRGALLALIRASNDPASEEFQAALLAAHQAL